MKNMPSWHKGDGRGLTYVIKKKTLPFIITNETLNELLIKSIL